MRDERTLAAHIRRECALEAVIVGASFSDSALHTCLCSWLAWRRREDFRQYRGETDPTKIQELLAYGQTELQVIQRQAQISRLYAAPERSVLEERKARAAASKPAGGPSDTAAPSATS